VTATWPWFSSIVVDEHAARAKGWMCAELATYHHEAYSLRAISRTLTCSLPPIGQRAVNVKGCLQRSMFAAGKEPPKEGVAALPQLTALADVLLLAKPAGPRVKVKCAKCKRQASSPSAAQMEDLAERLVP
jgi:hypothetical protein